MSYLLAAFSTDSGNSESPDVHSHPDGRLQKLWEGSSVRQFKAGQHVFRAGDAQLDLYKVESGTIRLYRNLADGRRQVIGFQFAGDLIGLGLQPQHFYSAQAVVSAQLHCVPISLMRSVALKDVSLVLELYAALSSEMAAVQDLALSIGRRDPEERLARFLVNLSRRNERHGQNSTAIDLQMPRSDIADHLGLTIETVSRTLGTLAKQRLINVVRRRSVRILDMKALEALMDGLRRMRQRRRNTQ